MIPRLKVSINLMNTLGEALPFLTDARVLGSASLRFRAVPEPRVGSHPGGRSCALYLRLQPARLACCCQRNVRPAGFQQSHGSKSEREGTAVYRRKKKIHRRPVLTLLRKAHTDKPEIPSAPEIGECHGLGLGNTQDKIQA